MNPDNELFIEPNDFIVFTYIENTAVATAISLKNQSDANLAFKIRTTSPDSYYVRPSIGVIGPNESKVINIILHPLKEYPKDMKDKFLVIYSKTLLGCDSSHGDVGIFWDSLSANSGKSMRLLVKVTESSGNQQYIEENKNKREIKEKLISEQAAKKEEKKVESLDFSRVATTIKLFVSILLGVYIYFKFHQVS